MWNLLERIINKGTKETSPKPVIVKGKSEADLSPSEKYALKPDRIYRVFPQNRTEEDVLGPCSHCGGKFEGPCQSHCPSCSQDRTAYMVDVTDQPYHVLPAEKEGEAPQVNEDDLIPTFGGESITTIGSESSFCAAAGNNVVIMDNCSFNAAAAKNNLTIMSNSDCENGLTAKNIEVRDNCSIGYIVIPNNGTLLLGDCVSIGTIFLGEGAKIKKLPRMGDNTEIEYLIMLGAGCEVSLGDQCTINNIECNHHFSLSIGDGYDNESRDQLSEDYNLIELINSVVDEALGLE